MTKWTPARACCARSVLLAALLPTLLLAPPSPLLASQHGDVEIPLRVEDGRLTVTVHAPDGTGYDFMLATGTPPTVLSESTAAALGEEPALTIGGLEVDFIGAMTLPDDRLHTAGFAFDGMIGPQTLNAYDMLLDVPGGRVVLRPIGRPAPWAGVTLGEPIPIRVLHGQMLAMEIELEGQTFFANLDTGQPVLVINEPALHKLGREPEFTGSVTLGGVRFTDLPVERIDLPILSRWDPDGAGFVLLGAPIAYDCPIAISWVRSEMQVCAR